MGVSYDFFSFLDDIFGAEGVTEMGVEKGTPFGTKTILTQGSYLVTAQLQEQTSYRLVILNKSPRSQTQIKFSLRLEFTQVGASDLDSLPTTSNYNKQKSLA